MHARIIGTATEPRRRTLASVDVLVGYTCARHALELTGWRVAARLVVDPQRGDLIALRATPAHGLLVEDLVPIDVALLVELGDRIVHSVPGVARVVSDVTTPAPPLAGSTRAWGSRDDLHAAWRWPDDAAQSA